MIENEIPRAGLVSAQLYPRTSKSLAPQFVDTWHIFLDATKTEELLFLRSPEPCPHLLGSVFDCH